jgi:chromosome partitioning protein
LAETLGVLTLAPRILTLANQKGGVGKTTTAINLATALAAIGERVLIVDLDPQGNASTGLGISRSGRDVSSYDLLVGGARLVEAAVMTSVPNVAIVPSTLDLLGVELTIAQQADRAFRLRDAFKAMHELVIDGKPISYVLIDCPPSLNLLTINALVAADAVLVPLQCEFFALEGLTQLLQTIEQIRSTLNPRAEHPGRGDDHVRPTQQSQRAGHPGRAAGDGFAGL